MSLEKQLQKHEAILRKILAILHVSPLFNHDYVEKLIIEMNETKVEEPEESKPDEKRYR